MTVRLTADPPPPWTAGQDVILTATSDQPGIIAIDYRHGPADFFKLVCTSPEPVTSWSCYRPFYATADHVGEEFDFRADRDYVDFSSIISGGVIRTPTRLTAHIYVYDLNCPWCWPIGGPAPYRAGFEFEMGYGTPPYNWTIDFGDGESASGQMTRDHFDIIDHTYRNPGTYVPVLTVTDAALAQSKSAALISLITSPWLRLIAGVTPLMFTAATIVYSEASKVGQF